MNREDHGGDHAEARVVHPAEHPDHPGPADCHEGVFSFGVVVDEDDGGLLEEFQGGEIEVSRQEEAAVPRGPARGRHDATADRPRDVREGVAEHRVAELQSRRVGQSLQFEGILLRNEWGKTEGEGKRACAIGRLGGEGPEVALDQRPGLRPQDASVLLSALGRASRQVDHRQAIAQRQPPLARDPGPWPRIQGLSRDNGA